MLVAEGTVLDTREAFTNLGASSKDVIAKDVVTRDALDKYGTFFTDVNVTVCYPPGMPSINMAPFHLANELDVQSPCNGRLYSLTAWRRVRVTGLVAGPCCTAPCRF